MSNTAVISLYFNEAPGAASSGWKPGDPLVESAYFNVVQVPIPDLTGFDPDRALEIIADAAYRAANADDRPNGQHERSLSVGDLVVVESSPTRDLAVLAVECAGWKQLSFEKWLGVMGCIRAEPEPGSRSVTGRPDRPWPAG